AAIGDRPAPGGGRRLRRLLGPEPVLPSLQAPGRRHAGAVPDARKDRQTGRKFLQEAGRQAPYHSPRAGQQGEVERVLVAHPVPLADYKVPESLTIVREIPRNALGKIDRGLLLTRSVT